MKKSELGLRGENLAAKYLAASGYNVIERNWRAGHLETDIICEDDGHLIFVEVKTRTPASDRYGRPSASVDRRKAARLIACAEAYIREKGLGDNSNKRVRLDVVEVYIDKGDVRINHIKNAIFKQEDTD